MDGTAARGRRPQNSIDIPLLLASFAMIAWIVVPH